MKKTPETKSQITIFVIIAIGIIAIIGILLLTTNNIKIQTNDDVNYNYIQDCLKTTSEEGIYYISGSGGYYNEPNESTKFGIPYYYIYGKKNVPSKEKIESELNNFMSEWSIGCGILNISGYKDINRGKPSVKSSISDNYVNFDISYPITISKNSQTYSYDKFSVVVPARLGILYKASSEYIDKQADNTGGMCINCMNDIANKYDLKFVTYDYDNTTVVFNILDTNSKINNLSLLSYGFSVKYNSSYILNL